MTSHASHATVVTKYLVKVKLIFYNQYWILAPISNLILNCEEGCSGSRRILLVRLLASR